jgi:hypothetical protein
MRHVYAHDAVLTMGPAADVNAPGAAVTAALCGHWEHEPPCPLAPHHSQSTRLDDDTVRIRILFATEPDSEAAVRDLIDSALASGALEGPSGAGTRWRLESSHTGCVTLDEQPHGERLVRS